MGLHTFLFKKMAFKPRSGAHDHYPYDLDGSLRFTRPVTGIDFWPAHDNADNFAQLGYVAGFMAQQDKLVWAQGYGKMPSGPIMGSITVPLNLQYQITIPGLSKQDSQ
jgi:hypothetical protein